MIYYGTEEKEKGFRFYEPERNPNYNKKTEAVFAQCNGFMGCRLYTSGMAAGFFFQKSGDEKPDFIVSIYDRLNCAD